MPLSFSVLQVDFTNMQKVLENKDSDNEFYDKLNALLKYAPEKYYEVRELVKQLLDVSSKFYDPEAESKIFLEEAHEIYKNHLKDTNYLLASDDYKNIIHSVLRNYSNSKIIRTKLLAIPPECVIDYLLVFQTKEVFLQLTNLFLESSLFVEFLFRKYKEITNIEDFQILLGFLKISGNADIEGMVDEMLKMTKDDFYKSICYVENEKAYCKYSSPTHFLAQNGKEEELKECSYQTEIAIKNNKL